MLNITDHDRRYWQYEYDTTAGYLVPLLRQWGCGPAGISLLDVGCGDGGNLCALADAGTRCSGFDVDPRRVELAGMLRGDRQCSFLTGDLAGEHPPYQGGKFDLVFLHDVFEHLERKKEMLGVLGEYLVPGGKIIITFPPYFSAFGAHQQLLKSAIGRFPFIHLVPGFESWMLGMLRDEPETFVEEIRKLARLRMGISSFERVVGSTGFRVCAKRAYLVGPNHIRFGLRPVGAGLMGTIPGVREIVVSGIIYLISK